MRIVIDEGLGPPLSAQRIEIVERKGIGHPDTICDGVVEAASVALCDAYLRAFGRVLHFNLDKALLVAGRTTPRLGGGVVDEPMRFIFGDRATQTVNDVTIPIGALVERAASRWVREHLRFVDPERHLAFQNEIKPGAPELRGLFDAATPGANDTSAAVGYAPLTDCERLVLAMSHHLASRGFHERFPEAGDDVKVMGIREGQDVRLIVAVAFVDRFVASERVYFERKAEIAEAIAEQARAVATGLEGIRVDVNALDRPGAGASGMYLTVLGTSAESGDSGQVGRGNRSNGLANASRPMSAEAIAGKNPVSHVGKIYSFLAEDVAVAIHENVEGVAEAYVRLCSRIGDPLDEPALAAVDVRLDGSASFDAVEPRIRRVVAAHVSGVTDLVARLVRGERRIP